MKFAKVMFFTPVCHSVHRGACMAGGHAGQRHVWQGVCMARSVRGGGHVWQGGIHGRGHAWQEACMAGGCACHACPRTPRDTVGQCAGGTHPTGMHSCYSFPHHNNIYPPLTVASETLRSSLHSVSQQV